MFVALLVLGLGNDDFQVRQVSQEALVIYSRFCGLSQQVIDARKNLDLEITMRANIIVDNYCNELVGEHLPEIWWFALYPPSEKLAKQIAKNHGCWDGYNWVHLSDLPSKYRAASWEFIYVIIDSGKAKDLPVLIRMARNRISR